MNGYNGYTARERDRKYQEFKRLRALGQARSQAGPCELCLNPGVAVEPHSEDYSIPYLWLPPAEYMICRSCHDALHKRFSKPGNWTNFKDHIRRGGYAAEFATLPVVKQRALATVAREQGELVEWPAWPGRISRSGFDWWEHLTMAPDSITAAWARPRP